MIIAWHISTCELKYQLSSKTLASRKYLLNACEMGIRQDRDKIDYYNPASLPITDELDGCLIRGVAVLDDHRKLRLIDRFIVYSPYRYKRYYVDLAQQFESYKNKFSTKTKSGLDRKVRKFSKYCDGQNPFSIYKTRSDMTEFHRMARSVSAKTYQENLLNAGLPASSEFVDRMYALAESDSIRGYILFHKQTPVAYLYLTAKAQTLVYNYLGFDPNYMKWSVGTVLHWLALESLFQENRFVILDFTEGEGQQKRTFSTDSFDCTNTYVLRKTVKNLVYIYLHMLCGHLSVFGGNLLDRLGLKPNIKKLIRYGIMKPRIRKGLIEP